MLNEENILWKRLDTYHWERTIYTSLREDGMEKFQIEKPSDRNEFNLYLVWQDGSFTQVASGMPSYAEACRVAEEFEEDALKDKQGKSFSAVLILIGLASLVLFLAILSNSR